ncbi:MAG: transglycosylase domain-containing protein [Candidatus Shapirobacteria bacterium]|jgi:penicillin-binding protein 1C
MSGTKNKKAKRKKTKGKKLRLALFLGIFLLLTGIVVLAVAVSQDLPNPKKLMTYEYPESSQIFDNKGKLLYEMYSEKRRLPVELGEVPESLKKATLAIEDSGFYSHFGFDLRGIVRGLYRTIVERRLQGGSTLTQQLVKNALLTPERTVSRKIKEAVLTVVTEIYYSKDQILEMYFNQTPYGGTLWGVQAASKGIFNKNVGELTLAESALIAGLPGSPSKYSPFKNPVAAINRRNMVLARMRELEYITAEQEEQSKNEEPNFYINKGNLVAPHFVFYVRQQLIDKYGIKKVNEGGLKIKTTLDSDLQNFAETAIASEMAKLVRYKVSNGAALITEPKSGKILAMVGSKDYFSIDIDGEYNVTTALRQPGSSIKPLNYAVAIENGKITAASVINDGPTCFNVTGLKSYCPTNYGNRYFGLQTVRNSLASSLNIAAVKVLKLNGLEAFVASASAMGISTFNNASDFGLSLTLGGGEVKMTDMNVAFGVLANMGSKQPLNPILEVRDRNDEVIDEYKYVPGDRVLSRETSFIIQQILSDDGARAMVFGRGSMLNIKGHSEVAVKTGTTNDLRDNWTIGYTPDVVVTTWVGNNDNSKMSGVVSGTTGAAPIWNKIMTYYLQDRPIKKPVMPSNVVGMYVCNVTGGLVPDEGCDSHYEYFKNEYKPTSKIPLRANVLIDKDTGRVVSDGDNKPNTEWQDHAVIKDISGVTVCLDCPLTNPEAEKVVTTIN